MYYIVNGNCNDCKSQRARKKFAKKTKLQYLLVGLLYQVYKMLMCCLYKTTQVYFKCYVRRHKNTSKKEMDLDLFL